MSGTGSGDGGWPAEFDEVVEQLKQSLARHSGDVTPVADLAQVLVLAAEQRHGRRVRWTVGVVALLIAVALAAFFAGTGGSSDNVHVASGPVSTTSTTQRATTTTVAATTVAPTTGTPTTVAPVTTAPHVTAPRVRVPPRVVTPASGPTCSPDTPDPNSTVGQFYAGVNNDRAANGEGPLCWNDSLASTASQWSQTMSTTAVGFNHPTDLTPMCAGVPNWTSCTQALGNDSPSVSVLMNYFVNDPDHQAIILGQSGPANMIGIGVVPGTGGLWVTMNFAFA